MAEQRKRGSRASKSGASKGRAKSTGTRKVATSTPPKPPAQPVAEPKPATQWTEARPPQPQRVAPDLSRERLLAERPLPGERRGSPIPTIIGTLLLAAAGVIATILILGGGDDENAAVETQNTPGVSASPGGQAQRMESCEPIGGGTANGGKTYAVTSSAADGDPIGCAEARSVLLTALSGGTTIGGWSCTTDPSAPTIVSCTSAGGRTIQARG
jgi:hypothetical protein